jgi:hypothetical protein
MSTLPLLAMLQLTACAGDTAVDSGPVGDTFCSTLGERGMTERVDGGATGASGALFVRVITSASGDVRDPLYVAFKDYSLEHVTAGGSQTTGYTSGDGLVEELLGPGIWAFRASFPRGSRTCVAEMQVEVQAGTTTRACAVMECPE